MFSFSFLMPFRRISLFTDLIGLDHFYHCRHSYLHCSGSTVCRSAALQTQKFRTQILIIQNSKVLHLKPEGGQNNYSNACFAYRQGFLSIILPSRYIQLHFSLKTLPSSSWLSLAYTGFCVGPQNTIELPALSAQTIHAGSRVARPRNIAKL